MTTNSDADIIALISECIGRLFEETDLQLTFECNGEDGFAIVYKEDRWVANRELDPLSCILYFRQPLMNKGGDDNDCVSTIMKMFGKSSGWVRSFQDGIRGRYNSSTSITGYMVGTKARKENVDCKKDIG